jgi:hypothetical protein
MDDVVIRKCTLRIVRHGGWTWGMRRRAIYENATVALPRLIAQRLADLLGEVEGEITQPIRLRFALRAGQLASGEGLAEVIARGVRAELLPVPATAARAAPGRTPTAEQDPVATREMVSASRDDTIDAGPVAGPLALLLRWRAQGVLWQRLQGFSRRALDLWLSAFLADLLAACPAAAVSTSESLDRDCAAIRRGLPASDDDVAFVCRARLAIAVEIVARHGVAVSARQLVQSLDAVIPVATSEPVASEAEVHTGADARIAEEGEARHTARGQPMRDVTAPRVPVSAGQGRVELCSVLPYLVLGALHRLGWLDVAVATLRALDVPDRGSVYATALAYKVLAAPARGWHREAAVLRTAAAFAGVRVPASPLELAGGAAQPRTG